MLQEIPRNRRSLNAQESNAAGEKWGACNVSPKLVKTSSET